MMRCTVVASSLLVAVLAAPGQADVLLNSGFESGSLSPWYQAADFSSIYEPWHVTNSDAHTGSFSATAIGDKLIEQDFAPIPVSSILEISLWLRQPEPNTGFGMY